MNKEKSKVNKEKPKVNKEKSKENRGNSRERSGNRRRQKEENGTIENSDSGTMNVGIDSCNRGTTQLRH